MESARAVSQDEGRAFAEQHGLYFVEASALKGDAVNHAFEHIIEKIFDHHVTRVKTLEAESKAMEDGGEFKLQGESVDITREPAAKTGSQSQGGCC
jgi:GTPase SAR1 family protein